MNTCRIFHHNSFSFGDNETPHPYMDLELYGCAIKMLTRGSEGPTQLDDDDTAQDS